MINLELTIEEVNSIVNVLFELPTKTGAWPLTQKIIEQTNAQTQKEPTAE